MAAVTSCFDTGDHGVFFRMGNGQFKILNLIPVVGICLGHHGLRPLLVEIHVTTLAGFRFFKLIVAFSAQGMITCR